MQAHWRCMYICYDIEKLCMRKGNKVFDCCGKTHISFQFETHSTIIITIHKFSGVHFPLYLLFQTIYTAYIHTHINVSMELYHMHIVSQMMQCWIMDTRTTICRRKTMQYCSVHPCQ